MKNLKIQALATQTPGGSSNSSVKFLLILLGLCISCGNQKQPAQDISGMKVLTLTDEHPVTPADLIADYRYVPLGETQQLIGEIDQLLVTDDRIIVVDKSRSQAVFIFDHNGNLLSEIHALGRGPAEYAQLDYVAVKPGDNPQLALLDARSKKVLIYDLSGQFIKTIATPFRVCGIEYLDADNAVCFTDAYAKNDPFFAERDDAEQLLFFTNDEFLVKASAMPNQVTQRQVSFTCPIVMQDGEGLLANPNLRDTIYRIDGAELHPLYFIDRSKLGNIMPTENLTDEAVAELHQKSPVFDGNFIPAEKFMVVCISTPPDGVLNFYYYSKESEQTYLLKADSRDGDAALADIAFNGIKTSWKNQFVAQVPAFVVPMVYPKGADNPILKDIKEDSNPVLIFYTLKEPQ